MSPRPAAGEIRFEAVTKSYRLGRRRAHLSAALPWGTGMGPGERINALDDVSFGVAPGESFGLVGGNGAGKSTALKCLGGIVAPTSGVARTGGRVVALIELGIGFHSDLSGLENARFSAAVAGLRGKAVARAVDEAVAFSELERFIDTPVKRYSSGMYGRLSFGIVAALPADVLMIDEVLAVGDLSFQRKCYEHLNRRRQEAGVTVVCVSHNEWVLNETCERGLLLNHGRVEAIGPIGTVLNEYHRLAEATPDQAIAGTQQIVRIESMRVEPEGRMLAMHGGITVEAEVFVAEAARHPVVAAALFDNDGRLLWGVYSDESGQDLKPGRQAVRLEIEDVAARPGPHRFQFFALDRSSPAIEDLRRIDLIIEGDAATGFENGLVHVNHRWSSSAGEA